MMRDSYSRGHQNPLVLESMEIVVALILMAVCWFAWYVARERFYLENRQIVELACYVALIGLAVVGSAILIITNIAALKMGGPTLRWLSLAQGMSSLTAPWNCRFRRARSDLMD